MAWDVQKIFAKRIGGEEFGKVLQTFKFTIIDNNKREFIARNPRVRVIDMGVGEPEELPSEEIMTRLGREAHVKANRIYPCNGPLEFRQVFASYLKRTFNINVDGTTEVMHCVGTKTALAQIPLAFVDPGDTVITTSPGYPVLPLVCEWLGAKVTKLKLEARNRFLPDINEIKKIAESSKLKLLLLNYPNNPTGAVAPKNFYQEMVSLAKIHNFIIVQDAAYADFCFDGEYISPLHCTDGKEVTLELYSLSKSYNMQGYRLGAVVGSASLVKAFSLVKDNTDNGAFIPIQKAGVTALETQGDFLKANREKYKHRLNETAKILCEAGIPAEPSPGTFYLYVKTPETFKDKSFSNAQEFSSYLLSQLGIVTVPWDEAGAFLRFSMTFEIGTQDFAKEEDVFKALRERLTSGELQAS